MSQMAILEGLRLSRLNEGKNDLGSAVKVLKSGKVKIEKTFKVKEFDEDDGWVSIRIKPGTYEYRLLDFRGWKPRQIKIKDDWIDVAGECEELEAILGELKLDEAIKKRPMKNLVLLRANFNEKLHDAILRCDQKTLDKFIEGLDDDERSWYEGEVKADKKLKRELEEQDKEDKSWAL